MISLESRHCHSLLALYEAFDELDSQALTKLQRLVAKRRGKPLRAAFAAHKMESIDGSREDQSSNFESFWSIVHASKLGAHSRIVSYIIM